jgi:hypothetical protein
MMKMFAFISIFFIPVMFMYGNNDQEAMTKQSGLNYMISGLSLGNLGGSDIVCQHNPLMFNEINLHCPVGRI